LPKAIHTAAAAKKADYTLKTGVAGKQINTRVFKKAAKQIATQIKDSDESGTIRTTVQAVQVGAAVIGTAGVINDKLGDSLVSAAENVKTLTDNISEWKSTKDVKTETAAEPPQKKKYVLIDRENGTKYAKSHFRVTKILKGEHTVFGIENAKNPTFKEYLKVATLKTATVGVKTLKTTAVIGTTGLLKTAVVVQKGLTIAGNAMTKSDDETVRAMGQAAYGADYMISAGKTAAQAVGKTVKTIFKGTKAAAKGINSFAVGIKTDGIKKTIYKAAKTGVTRVAAAGSKIVKEFAAGLLKKTVIPLALTVVVVVAAAQTAVTPLVSAVVYVKRLMPFTSVFEWVDGVLTEKDSPMKDTLELYIRAEASVVADTNATITRLFAGMNETTYNVEGGVINPDMLDEYAQHNAAYVSSMMQYTIASQMGMPYYTAINPNDGTPWLTPITEPPEFDKTKYILTANGYKNEQGQYVTDGSKPAVAPKYEGAEWAENTDTEEEVPHKLQAEMIAALVVYKIKLEEEGEAYEEWTEAEVKRFYNSLPHWTLTIESGVEHCEGCEEYTYEYEVEIEVEHTNPDGTITITTETVTMTAVVPFCPGHITDYVNIQMDEDPAETIVEDQFNMERVFEKLGFTEAEIKLYEETLKNIEKELR
jgi:hypothetical protein